VPEKTDIVIVGGGTAGWMCAAALAAQGIAKLCRITLVEGQASHPAGAGYTTLPSIKAFHRLLGLDEADLLRQTLATFKLGTEFSGWSEFQAAYFHPFGSYGDKAGGLDFLQHWLRARGEGLAQPLEDYSYCIAASKRNRFDFPTKDPKSIASTYDYAYHLDADLYKECLKNLAVNCGVIRLQDWVDDTGRNSVNGNIERLMLKSGKTLKGDFFIDCSGSDAILIGESLGVGAVDCSHWLPCDRTIAISSSGGGLPPYTRVMAKAAGWQWKIPLQNSSNGYVYSSGVISDDEAANELHKSLDGNPVSAPLLSSFKSGYRETTWYKNCVAVGAAGACFDPLEPTGLYLVQAAITQLIRLFPGEGQGPMPAKEFNRHIEEEYTRIRDFLILHYHLASRTDSEIWRHCKEMVIPEALEQKITLFKKRGFLDVDAAGPFPVASWISVMTGQGIWPESTNPLRRNFPREELHKTLGGIRGAVNRSVENMSSHREFISQYLSKAAK